MKTKIVWENCRIAIVIGVTFIIAPLLDTNDCVGDRHD
jgi:hypothetical protein